MQPADKVESTAENPDKRSAETTAKTHHRSTQQWPTRAPAEKAATAVEKEPGNSDSIPTTTPKTSHAISPKRNTPVVGK